MEIIIKVGVLQQTKLISVQTSELYWCNVGLSFDLLRVICRLGRTVQSVVLRADVNTIFSVFVHLDITFISLILVLISSFFLSSRYEVVYVSLTMLSINPLVSCFV